MSSSHDYIPSEAYIRGHGGRVASDQRHTKQHPCEVCQGADGDKRGRGVRCWGFTTGAWCFCTNDDFAGSLAKNMRTDAYVHKLDGPCRCGEDHSGGYQLQPLRRREPITAGAAVKITRSHIGRPPADYTHQYGENLRLLRWGSGPGKILRWQHFDRDHGWIDGQGPYSPGFYRATEIAAADLRKPIYLAGGEKCVDELVKVGAVAGCNPGGEGSGKWRAEDNALFADRHVVILADADTTGRDHAHAIAASLAGVAASVRVLELEGAHDVADWLADGHTLTELLEIIACSSPAQYSNPALQDGRTAETQKTGCPNCSRERELRQMAETSLTNLRREQAMTARILALPNDKLAAPVKLAAVAVRQILAQPRARDEEGMEQVYRAAIARQCGVSDQTAGAHLRKLEDAGVIRRRIEKTFDQTKIFISEGNVFNAPESIPTPERANGWGGKRVKGCPHCGSADIIVTSYACRGCGSHLNPDELIDVEAQEQTQDTPLPPYLILNDLAPDVLDTGDTPCCPICGRAGDELRDYGDGVLRCIVCDLPAAVG